MNTTKIRREAVDWFQSQIKGNVPGKRKAIQAIRDAEDPKACAKGWVKFLDNQTEEATDAIAEAAFLKIKAKLGVVPAVEGRLLRKLVENIRLGEYTTAKASRIADAIVNKEGFSWA